MKKTASFDKKRDEYFEGLRAIVAQARRDGWDQGSTRMAIQAHWLAVEMKWNDKQPIKGVINDT